MSVTSTLLRLPSCSVLSKEISTRRRFDRVRCAEVRAEPSAQGQKRKYKDSFTDLVFINGCRQAFGRVAGWQVGHISYANSSLPGRSVFQCCSKIRVCSDRCQIDDAPSSDVYADSSLQSSRSWEEGYEGMVEVSHALARNRNAAQQQAAVLQVRHYCPPRCR